MNRSTAFKFFGEMRCSTLEEQQAYREMLKKHSTIIEGINIFEMDKLIKDSNKDGTKLCD